MDFDIEMEDAAEQYHEKSFQETAPQEGNPLHETGEDGEVDGTEVETAAAAAEDASANVALNKIHIRGLDALNPDDIIAYVSEHFPGDGGHKGPFDRIEWIDDTSANLVFQSEDVAATALAALSGVPLDDVVHLQVGQLLPAKPYSAKPDDVSAGLSVRYAVETDKKEAGAATRSRFYLLHPEYDPEERKRNHRNRRRDGRDGSYSDSRHRRHRSYRDDRDDRENDIRNNYFDASLYDDDGPAQPAQSRSEHPPRRRSYSRSPSRDRSYSPNPWAVNRGKELFPVSSNPKGRELFPEMLDASASINGRDYDRSGKSRDIGRLRDRSASPRRVVYDFFHDEASAIGASRSKARAGQDLLPTKNGHGRLDLFPDNTRSSAQMDLLGSYSRPATSLSDRITRPSETLNVRGSAGTSSKQGISIKGASSARELFPSKLDNNQDRKGGRMFSDNSLSSRIQRPRQRAEDLFH
ncbi:hypothetical protein SEPCBS119000_002305 [Sporothrix epigloea]|uniref:Nucleotide-binding, alpha-beta plait n=1 Tax=Sporothrix epigloea TaxID=1892477 RepID=A0ABP0DI91_9PEZI